MDNVQKVNNFSISCAWRQKHAFFPEMKPILFVIRLWNKININT
jgi:hypothetical protein